VHSLGHRFLLGFNDDALAESIALLPTQFHAPGFGNFEPRENAFGANLSEIPIKPYRLDRQTDYQARH
jgi:hypothetical protein